MFRVRSFQSHMQWILRRPENPQDPSGRSDPIGPDGMPRLIRKLLLERSLVDAAGIRRYLEPSLDELSDPELLPDLRRAVVRLDEALRAGEKIFLFGDYDVDGMTSVALLRRSLSRLGGRLHARIPDRLTEGYGLSTAAVDEARAWGAKLLVAADCGTTARVPIARAREAGIDVIVADHHQPDEDPAPGGGHRESLDGRVRRLHSATSRPSAWRPGSSKDCGACRNERGEDSPSPYDLLDLTALGTIADSVRLEQDNRVLVHHGLRILRENPRPCMRALMRICGMAPERASSGEIAYRLAPRLNAAGRLGDAPTALALLLCEDEDRCDELAAVLDRHNRERQTLLDRVVRDALARAEEDGSPGRGEPIVLESGDWHIGVLGIAAARLAEQFGVPTILLSRDGSTLRGSGRTAGDCDLLALVRGCSSELATFGGHRAAVGLSLDAGELRPGSR